MSIWILVGGAVSGAGVLLLTLILVPPRVQPAPALAELDTQRDEARLRRDARRLNPAEGALPDWLDTVGFRSAALLRRTGIGLSSLSSDLAMVGRSLERHLVISLMCGLAAFAAPLTLVGVATALGSITSWETPVLACLVLGALAVILPTVRLRGQADAARRDFRHVVGSYLDLVSMSLAAGRGVPEALDSAATLSDDPAMVRIRDALAAARLRGETPWAAMGQLGDQLRIDELRDLSAALALVAEDGAKIRESLSARATSMRRRELADAEGKAGESSESMLVAQLIIAMGFIVFLVYPALAGIMGST
ncbi:MULTISPECIES: type II secretion system F family protein [unclassified Actinomyces]|uniref:type II secretion system F family protein n=1 Tax=unclassified Actinomyces TaxID=2609248 RepID=UPI000D5A0588|nr:MULTISPECIES: type II secretion system F family protein [unclassified Actinomyces]RAX20647.1 type II secretion protein F [Actinomyces sp. Z3]